MSCLQHWVAFKNCRYLLLCSQNLQELAIKFCLTTFNFAPMPLVLTLPVHDWNTKRNSYWRMKENIVVRCTHYYGHDYYFGSIHFHCKETTGSYDLMLVGPMPDWQNCNNFFKFLNFAQIELFNSTTTVQYQSIVDRNFYHVVIEEWKNLKAYIVFHVNP